VTARQRLQAVREELRAQFVERDELVDGALVALLARAHVLVVGLPGTAKSQVAHEVCRRVGGAVYFQWLLTKFTTPEELFGPISLRALEQDRYERVTGGMMPRAHVVFLDEIFKASSAILNALLTLVNERRFHNAGAAEPVPLVTLFGATNELPDEDELRALYDRFLLRYVVDYVQEDFRFLKMLTLPEPGAPAATLALDDLTALQAEAARVEVPQARLGEMARLRRALRQKGVVASDRRWRQALGVLRARAFLDGRTAVGEADLSMLAHVLWQDPAERGVVQQELQQLLSGHEEEARQLLFQARELHDYARREFDDEDQATRALIEAYAKIRKIVGRVDELVDECRARGRDPDLVAAVREEVNEIRRDVEDAAAKQGVQ
jgi:MoxR-like ATPase